jgi:hypothetical protein
MPVLHLYRTQLEALADYLDVPEPVRSKPADPDLMPGITDKGAMLGSFERTDAILWGLENGLDAEELAASLGAKDVERVRALVELSARMRQVPYKLSAGAGLTVAGSTGWSTAALSCATSGTIPSDVQDWPSTLEKGQTMEKRAASNRLPRWAPRVSQLKIRQLYEADARGIYDLDLIHEVGYGLLARCESFITANRARAGELPCPECGRTVRRQEMLRCPCGWTLPWADYFKTIQHKQLSGAEPVLKQFRDFVEAFPAARMPQEKMLLIDRLIHGFHWYYKTNRPTRPVAVNLIEGRLSDVVAFLDRLSYGDKSTPGTQETYAEWDKKIDANRDWYRSRRNASPKQESGDD